MKLSSHLLAALFALGTVPGSAGRLYYGPVHKPTPRPFGGPSTRKSFTIHGVKVQSAFTRPKS